MRAALVMAVCAACGRGESTRASAPPAHDAVRIEVLAGDPGLRADEIETELVGPIEEAVSRMPGLVAIHSESRPGEARIEVELTSVDPLGATSAVRATLPVTQLPASAQAPIVKLAPGSVALRYTLTSDTLSASQVRDLQDRVVGAAVERAAGIGDLDVCGASPPRVLVQLDPPKLTAFGLAVGDVRTALRGNQADIQALGDVVVEKRNNVPVRLRDVAVIEQAAARLDCYAAVAAGRRILVTVHATQGGNVAAARDAAQRALAEAMRELPPGVTVEPLAPSRELIVALPSGDLNQRARVADQIAKVPGAALVAVTADRATVFAQGDISAAILNAVPSALAMPDDSDLVSIVIEGPDLDQLATATAVAASAAGQVPGARLLPARPPMISTERVTPDRAKANELGIAAPAIAEALHAATAGLPAGMVAGVPIEVKLRVEHLDEVRVLTKDRVAVPLSAIAALETREEPALIVRENRLRAARVQVHAHDKAALQRVLAAVTLPPGYRLTTESRAAP
jgi:multidrug efflux pump subunit AcrB